MRNPAHSAFVVLALVWGSTFLFAKWSLEVITPGQTALLRVLFGLLPVAAWALARGAFSRAHLRHAHHFAAMSVLATTLHFLPFAAGAERLPSGVAGVVAGAIPLFSLVIAAVALRDEPLTAPRVAGVVIGFAGVLVIARPWSAAGALDPTGVLYLLIGSASVGLSFVYAKRYVAPLAIAPEALTTYQMGLGLLTLTLLTDLDGIGAIAGDGQALVGLVLGLGLLGTGVASVLYYVIVERLGAVAAASSTYLPPVVALALGCLVAGEVLHVLDVVAVALILGGVVAAADRSAEPDPSFDGGRVRPAGVRSPACAVPPPSLSPPSLSPSPRPEPAPTI